jgi:hypothetical protein
MISKEQAKELLGLYDLFVKVEQKIDLELSKCLLCAEATANKVQIAYVPLKEEHVLFATIAAKYRSAGWDVYTSVDRDGDSCWVFSMRFDSGNEVANG